MAFVDCERLIFIKELMKLYAEYMKCHDSKVRICIIEDIFDICRTISKLA
ncbi:hypothetical protein SAMN05443252_105237 [Bacillus sp. OV322]|nr:hypothetical protein SAMN05443252_105237 [Bacillus sp. OV322]